MIPLSAAILRDYGGVAARTGPLVACPTGPLIAIQAPGAARSGPLIAVAVARLRKRNIARTGPMLAFPIVAFPILAILPFAIRAPGGAALTEPLLVLACLRKRGGLPILMILVVRRFALPMAFVGCHLPHLLPMLCRWCSGTCPVIIGWWWSVPSSDQKCHIIPSYPINFHIVAHCHPLAIGVRIG